MVSTFIGWTAPPNHVPPNAVDDARAMARAPRCCCDRSRKWWRVFTFVAFVGR
jgi:hypothetical protein